MNEPMNKHECMEVLSAIARDSTERATERIKAIELLTRLQDDEYDIKPVIIDDIS